MSRLQCLPFSTKVHTCSKVYWGPCHIPLSFNVQLESYPAHESECPSLLCTHSLRCHFWPSPLHLLPDHSRGGRYWLRFYLIIRAAMQYILSHSLDWEPLEGSDYVWNHFVSDSLALCIVYSRCLIKVLMPFMMMHGLQLVTTTTA